MCTSLCCVRRPLDNVKRPMTSVNNKECVSVNMLSRLMVTLDLEINVNIPYIFALYYQFCDITFVTRSTAMYYKNI